MSFRGQGKRSLSHPKQGNKEFKDPGARNKEEIIWEVANRPMGKNSNVIQPIQSCYREYRSPINWAFQMFDPNKFHREFFHCNVEDLSRVIKQNINSQDLLSNKKAKTLESVEFIRKVQQQINPQNQPDGWGLKIDKSVSRFDTVLQRSLMPPPDGKVNTSKTRRNGQDKTDPQKVWNQNKILCEDGNAFTPTAKFEEEKPVQFGNNLRREGIEEEPDFDFPVSPKNNRKMNRWGKCHDKKLFAAIRFLEKKGILKLNDLLTMNASTEAKCDQGVKILANKISWNWQYENLVERVKNLSDKKFSFREIKTLKRIIKKEYRHKPLDYEKILYHFPGKTVEKLMATCDHIMACIKDKSLSRFKNEK
ncbi:unnamed protein product [Moneuplotes crassus]|uniref:Uncharacterized protein n=1 Tax=Euplotes crassus TaxID=5936 RepID=A0AAD1U128_EUPCR|nr:unnamed protein product [Moneuplotes crassus]